MNVLAEDSGGGAMGVVGEDERPEQVIQASQGGQQDKVERPGVDLRSNSFFYFFAHFSKVFTMLLLLLYFKLYFKVIIWTSMSIINVVFSE